jgi:hypothetical protein
VDRHLLRDEVRAGTEVPNHPALETIPTCVLQTIEAVPMITITVTIGEPKRRPLRLSLITNGDAITPTERQAHRIIYGLILGLLHKVAADFKGSVSNYG